MIFVVDTHALIWFLEGDSRLGANARAILEDAGSELVLPAIALAEAVWIVERGKTSIPSVAALMSAVTSDLRITIALLDQAVIEQTIALTAIHEMHDRQIVATALLLQNQGETVNLLTCDQNTTSSGLVSILW